MTLDELLELQEILEVAGLTDPKKQFHPERTNLDSISSLVSKSPPKYRHVILDLVRYYDIFVDYRPYVVSLLKSALSQFETIAFFPITPKNAKVAKSGHNFLYEMRSLVGDSDFGRVSFYDSPYSRELLASSATKFAIDDYIGTGDQFLEMVNDMKKSNPAIHITGTISIVIMEKGRSNLEEEGYLPIFHCEKRKGISGYLKTAGIDVAAAYHAYDNLEGLVEVEFDVRRGYGNSEALVSMKRTPDNTLPIFWHTGKNRQWPAPFAP